MTIIKRILRIGYLMVLSFGMSMLMISVLAAFNSLLHLGEIANFLDMVGIIIQTQSELIWPFGVAVFMALLISIFVLKVKGKTSLLSRLFPF